MAVLVRIVEISAREDCCEVARIVKITGASTNGRRCKTSSPSPVLQSMVVIKQHLQVVVEQC